jgi:hypothetical protein
MIVGNVMMYEAKVSDLQEDCEFAFGRRGWKRPFFPILFGALQAR